MANTLIVRPVGPTMGLSVVATSHAAATLAFTGNDPCIAVEVVNTSATLLVAINLSGNGAAAVLPGDGVVGNYTLAPLASRVLPVSSGLVNGQLQVTAIASGAGPTQVLVTPVGMQT